MAVSTIRARGGAGRSAFGATVSYHASIASSQLHFKPPVSHYALNIVFMLQALGHWASYNMSTNLQGFLEATSRKHAAKPHKTRDLEKQLELSLVLVRCQLWCNMDRTEAHEHQPAHGSSALLYIISD